MLSAVATAAIAAVTMRAASPRGRDVGDIVFNLAAIQSVRRVNAKRVEGCDARCEEDEEGLFWKGE